MTRGSTGSQTERRASPHTLAAYGRDLAGVPRFPGRASRRRCRSRGAVEARAGRFPRRLARRAGAAIEPHLDRARAVRGAQLLPLPRPARPRQERGARRGRTPKLPKPVPKALSVDEAQRGARRLAANGRARPGIAQARRRAADAALRLRPAHRRGARARAATRRSPPARSPSPARAARRASCRCCRRWRDGDRGLSRRLSATPLAADGPLFVGARGGPLNPRLVQGQMAKLRAALGLPRRRDAARAAPQLRDASPGRRRRSARDPGTAGPRLPVDDAALHQVDDARLLAVYDKAHTRGEGLVAARNAAARVLIREHDQRERRDGGRLEKLARQQTRAKSTARTRRRRSPNRRW